MNIFQIQFHLAISKAQHTCSLHHRAPRASHLLPASFWYIYVGTENYIWLRVKVNRIRLLLLNLRLFVPNTGVPGGPDLLLDFTTFYGFGRSMLNRVSVGCGSCTFSARGHFQLLHDPAQFLAFVKNNCSILFPPKSLFPKLKHGNPCLVQLGPARIATFWPLPLETLMMLLDPTDP